MPSIKYMVEAFAGSPGLVNRVEALLDKKVEILLLNAVLLFSTTVY